MPDGDRGRHTLEQTIASVFDRKKAALTFGAFVTFAGFESLHQSHFCAVSQCDLLMTTTNAENRLARLLDYFKNSGERLRRVLIPRMTLSAQDDVRRAQTANSLERYAVERFSEDLDAGN